MTLSIVTWNIQKGIGVDFQRDLARTARVLRAQDADIIGLQEVLRVDGMDQAATLAANLDMKLAWGEARTVKRGTFGNAVLVRGEIISSRAHDLSVPHMEPRVCLEALVSARGETVRMFVCHFGLGPRERARQAARLLEVIRAAPKDVARVVVGDFNEWRRGPVDRAFTSEFPHSPRPARSHPSPLPLFALDRIAWDPPFTGMARVEPVQRASDHRLVRACISQRIT